MPVLLLTSVYYRCRNGKYNYNNIVVLHGRKQGISNITIGSVFNGHETICSKCLWNIPEPLSI